MEPILILTSSLISICCICCIIGISIYYYYNYIDETTTPTTTTTITTPTTTKPTTTTTTTIPTTTTKSKKPIKPRNTISDWGHVVYNGYPDPGWYDLQNQGVANDYCRVLGDSPNQFFACTFAGDTNYTKLTGDEMTAKFTDINNKFIKPIESRPK